MWGANEVLSERVLLTWARHAKDPIASAMEVAKPSLGEAQEDGKAFLWSKYKC